jgi:CheY-like chemotaxis protein
MNSENKKDTILFVDDEKICHTLVELIIPNFTEFKLINAYNGQEAINLAKRHENQICLVLLDIILPDISGPEIFKELRQNPKLKNTPFIFQSGLSSQEENIAKDTNENVKILQKPYKQNDLLAAINEAMGK